jgi:hypothetical protein
MSKWNLQFNETTCYFSNRAEQKEADQVAIDANTRAV